MLIAGYYDAPPAKVRDWLDAAKAYPGVEGVMYTTWENNYRDLEKFSTEIQDWEGRPDEIVNACYAELGALAENSAVMPRDQSPDRRRVAVTAIGVVSPLEPSRPRRSSRSARAATPSLPSRVSMSAAAAPRTAGQMPAMWAAPAADSDRSERRWHPASRMLRNSH